MIERRDVGSVAPRVLKKSLVRAVLEGERELAALEEGRLLEVEVDHALHATVDEDPPV